VRVRHSSAQRRASCSSRPLSALMALIPGSEFSLGGVANGLWMNLITMTTLPMLPPLWAVGSFIEPYRNAHVGPAPRPTYNPAEMRRLRLARVDEYRAKLARHRAAWGRAEPAVATSLHAGRSPQGESG
jgi:hypothetical protein